MSGLLGSPDWRGLLLEQQQREMTHNKSQSKDMPSLLDVVRGGLMGLSTDVLGAPVDLASMAMRPFGYSVPHEKTIGSSDWLANKLTTPTNSTAETTARMATGLLTPDATDLLHVAPLLAGIFAGKKAKTADLGALMRAEDMLKSGANREDIYNQTGWFKGVDGQWRFEIDDSNTRLTEWSPDHGQANIAWPNRKGPATAMPFEDYMSHPDVERAYFPLREDGPGVFFEDKNGNSRYVAKDDNIYIDIFSTGDKSDQKSITLHELQHAIQSREKFARGGNAEMFYAKDMTREYLEPIDNRIRFLFESNPDYANAQRKLNRMYSDLNDKYGKIVYNRAGSGRSSLNFADVPKSEYDEYMMAFKQVNTYPEASEYRVLDMKRYTIQNRDNILSPIQQYERLAGETEARTVEKRMNLTKEQRAARPPWLDYDIPEEEQIVRFR